MAIYRFKISFEDYDVSREIEIRSNQTFEDLHYALHQSIGYKPDVPSSFYVSNDHWHKGLEITIFPNKKRQEKEVLLMKAAKLNNYMDDPHQKFYYTSNFDRPFDFHVELTRILIEENIGTTYPLVVKTNGEPPKQLGSSVPPAASATLPDVEELLQETIFDEEEEETEDLGIALIHQAEDQEAADIPEEMEEKSEEGDDAEQFGIEDEDGSSNKEPY